MREWRGIEELHLSPHRPDGVVPAVSARLRDTIRQYGPIMPVVVREVGARQYEILGNAETWLALQQLGQHRVPVDVLPDVDDAEAMAIVAACTQDDAADPLDEARELAARLQALGGRTRWGATRRLAAMTGLSRSYISHAVRLLRLPAEIQQLVRGGRLSVGHAKLLVTVTDRGAQVALARRIEHERLSVRETEALARAAKTGGGLGEVALDPAADADLRRLERALSEALGCPTQVRAQDGTLVVDYAGDLDVLDGVLQRVGVRDF